MSDEFFSRVKQKKRYHLADAPRRLMLFRSTRCVTDKVQQQPHTFLCVLEWEAHMAESVAAVTTVMDRHKVCRVGYGRGY